eukprot:TRINITY_DN8914_c0_g2_i1.p1 TRINITY_DN8914_c0_g2~~TRINITY_DN8914_c0_g2_i1.p1  ORF type:complete len:119 (-),score=4.83 TRINITY_DN8914_c0_g2_i1:42-398(-)
MVTSIPPSSHRVVDLHLACFEITCSLIREHALLSRSRNCLRCLSDMSLSSSIMDFMDGSAGLPATGSTAARYGVVISIILLHLRLLRLVFYCRHGRNVPLHPIPVFCRLQMCFVGLEP